jgi:hypothetical protein
MAELGLKDIQSPSENAAHLSMIIVKDGKLPVKTARKFE